MERPISDYPATSVRGRIGGIRDSCRTTQEDAVDHAKSWFQTAGRWIAKNPALALGVSVAIGVYLGWMVKRR